MQRAMSALCQKRDMRRQGSKLYGAADKKCVAANEERIGSLARKCSKGRIDLSDRTGI